MRVSALLGVLAGTRVGPFAVGAGVCIGFFMALCLFDRLLLGLQVFIWTCLDVNR